MTVQVPPVRGPEVTEITLEDWQLVVLEMLGIATLEMGHIVALDTTEEPALQVIGCFMSVQ